MRRFAVLFFLVILLFPAFSSHIVSDGTLPDDVLTSLAEDIGMMTYGRKDLDFTASSYSEGTVIAGYVTASFTLSYGDRTLLVEFMGENRVELLESLEEEIENILFYSDELYSDAEERLDYILPPSYSFAPSAFYRKGTRLKAVDSLGNIRGVFAVSERYDDADTLEAIYLRSPFPGMTLEKSGNWTAYGTFATSFNFKSPELLGMVSIGRSDLIYPFVPIVSAAYRMKDGVSYVYGGIGIEAHLDMNRIFPSVEFTLIQEGRIGGNVSMLLGYGGEGFDWRSVFSIFYEHRATPSFFWRLGYENLQGSHMLFVGLGGDF